MLFNEIAAFIRAFVVYDINVCYLGTNQIDHPENMVPDLIAGNYYAD